MPAFHQFLSLMIRQQAGRQQLDRTPEPSQVTDATSNVMQYDRVMLTKLAVIYAAGLEVAERALPEIEQRRAAIDLACGPGHYTLCLAEHLGFSSVLGVDLSGPMVEVAHQNAVKQNLAERVSFVPGDATDLAHLSAQEFDFASFTGAAHHLPSLEDVQRVAREMDRITRPEGLVMIMDLVRLRTAALTEDYVNLLGRDYLDRDLSEFFTDFRNTMYAVWTADEFRNVIPPGSPRTWCHLVPRGLPSVQILLGLPIGRREPFLRRPAPRNPLVEAWHPRWQQHVGPAWADETANDVRLVCWGLRTASKSFTRPRTVAS